MGKTAYKRLKGSQNFRQRLVLATLSSTPILIEDIRTDDTWPGLLKHEVSLLRLLEKICDDCAVEINETGNLRLCIVTQIRNLKAFTWISGCIILFCMYGQVPS